MKKSLATGSLVVLALMLAMATATSVSFGEAAAKSEARSEAKSEQSESKSDKSDAKSDAKDVVETAVAAGKFKTLAAALKAADLIDTLKGPGPFTVFAPTDEAFEKLPAGTVEELLKPENKEKLKAILTYHVVAEKATSKDVAGMKSAKTVNGKQLKIRVKDGEVMVDKATVTKADIETSNGVIHVIDTVLMP
jgi:uncharacterized surface protein with fasciclin (FAS1) repeats